MATPKQPLTEDILYHIGLCLLPTPWDSPPSLAEQFDFEMNMYCLRKLTYLCRATRDLLEPLLFRFIILAKPQDVVHFYIDLIEHPHIRGYVRHMACITHRANPGNKSDSPANRVCRKILDERIGGRDNMLSIVKQGASWEPFALACSRNDKSAEDYFATGFNMRGDVDYMIRSILLTATNLKSLVWENDEYYMQSAKARENLKLAAELGRPLLPDLEVLAMDHGPSHGRHWKDLPWGEGCWRNLRRLVLYDYDFDHEFAEVIFEEAVEGLVPVEELVVRRKKGKPVDASNLLGNAHLGPDGQLHVQKNWGLFCIFPNLKLLDVSFPPRGEDGSLMLKAFLHWVGAPERLHLTGHPLPFEALATGAVHSRLKSVRVREWKDGEDLGEGEVRQRVEGWWRSHSEVVPSLGEFVVQRSGESDVDVRAP